MRFPALLLALTCLAAPLAAATIADEPLPADRRWALRLDVQALLAGKVGATLRGIAAQEPHRSRLAMLTAVSGLDPLRDLSAVTVAGADADESHVVILLRGAFDAGKLAIIAGAAQDHRTVTAGSRTIHLWISDEKKGAKTQAGCLAAPDLLVLAQNEEQIRAVLAVLDAPATGRPALALPAGWQGAPIALATASDLGTWAKAGPSSATLRQLRSFAARVDEAGDEVVLKAQAQAVDEATARNLVNLANGLSSWVQLTRPGELDPGLIAALQGALVVQNGALVEATVRLPAAAVSSFIETHQPGARRPQPPPAQAPEQAP
jgi:hypothetical protein